MTNTKLVLTAKSDTYLKKQPIDSLLLDTDSKKLVKEGDTIFVDSYKKQNTHTLCTLSYNSGDWYIFHDHWKGLPDLEDIRRISSKGIELIKHFEGLHRVLPDGRIQSYKDVVGVLTIGYGSTGRHVKEGMTITREEAEDLLLKDLDKFEKGVSKLVKVKLNQNQFDALVSFAFNVGVGALGRSTLIKRLNKGDYEGAADQLLKWTKAGNKIFEGLVRRRKAEKNLFEGENWQV
jgi:lysozyme